MEFIVLGIEIFEIKFWIVLTLIGGLVYLKVRR